MGRYVPYDHIFKVVQHIHEGSALDDFCEAIVNGDSRDHVYHHVRNLMDWWIEHNNAQGHLSDLMRV
jgi:hypothetical protein